MTASLGLGVLLAPVAVAEEVPEDAQTVEPERKGYYAADQSNYTDNVLLSQFPPEAICLVAPQACFFPEDDSPQGQLGGVGNEAFSTIDEGERELFAQIAENDSAEEPNPVPPGSLPVSVIAGQPYHRSALEIPLPDLPEGDTVDSFTMVLTQGQPTYSNESPAFRQAVLAALTCASENDESPFGRCTQEEFEKVPAAELTNDSPVLVEACPITGEWDGEENQDEDEIPEADCLFTAAGIPVDGTNAWVFDLTFAAQAWYDGTFPNNGLLLRPGAAENFAYGDPETTYSKQVTFDGTVQIAMESSEGFTAPPPSDPPASSTTTTPPPPPSSSGSTGGTSTAPPPQPQPQSGGAVNPPTTGQPSTAQQPTVSQPESSAPAETAPPQQPAAEQPQTLAAGTPLGTPENQWWLWLLVIPFLGGAFLLARSLEEEAVAATERSGAMTRLLERQAAARSDDLVTG